ncbi:MAG: DUF3500 domain-containing protein [Acidimicrobiales bacterium]
MNEHWHSTQQGTGTSPADNSFRDILPPPDHPSVAGIGERDAYTHGDRLTQSERGRAWLADIDARVAQPFTGITTDGNVVPSLFETAGNGAPTGSMVASARRLLNGLGSDDLARVMHPIDATEWRRWANPELYVNRHGLRLDELGASARHDVLDVVRATLSAPGFDKARACMIMNGFLGSLVGGTRVMNEYSYNFSLFGEPSLTEPWGWQLHGHHLALNAVVIGDQLIISPSFMGAEPNIIDEGPYAGLTIFNAEELDGLALMRSLPEDQRRRAQIYEQMYDPSMPPGRFHFADQRHLGGAYHDNRIIPFEGVNGAELTGAQRTALVELALTFVEYLPAPVLEARRRELEAHIDDTWFSWIGHYGDDDPFYYRIQSPVIMCEFDHHSGVFLTNTKPAKCHIHTVVRTPNGNDYGKDLLRQHYEQVHGLTPATEESS